MMRFFIFRNTKESDEFLNRIWFGHKAHPAEGPMVRKHGTEHGNCDVGHSYANCRSQRAMIVACENSMYKRIAMSIDHRPRHECRTFPLDVSPQKFTLATNTP